MCKRPSSQAAALQQLLIEPVQCGTPLRTSLRGMGLRHWVNPILGLIAIIQVIYFLSRRSQTVPKQLQNVSAYIPPVPKLPNFLTRKKKPSSAIAHMKHPIAKLMEDAEADFRATVRRQSHNVDKAAEEYKRRYGRYPPKGFEDWFKFAVENKVRIIDEYDSMIKDLKPFEELSGAELRARALQVRCSLLGLLKGNN